MFVERLNDGMNEGEAFWVGLPQPLALLCLSSLKGEPVLGPAPAQPQHPHGDDAPGDQGLVLHHPTAPLCRAVAGPHQGPAGL